MSIDLDIITSGEPTVVVDDELMSAGCMTKISAEFAPLDESPRVLLDTKTIKVARCNGCGCSGLFTSLQTRSTSDGRLENRAFHYFRAMLVGACDDIELGWELARVYMSLDVATYNVVGTWTMHGQSQGI